MSCFKIIKVSAMASLCITLCDFIFLNLLLQRPVAPTSPFLFIRVFCLFSNFRETLQFRTFSHCHRCFSDKRGCVSFLWCKTEWTSTARSCDCASGVFHWWFSTTGRRFRVKSLSRAPWKVFVRTAEPCSYSSTSLDPRGQRSPTWLSVNMFFFGFFVLLLYFSEE